MTAPETQPKITPEFVEDLFTRSNGDYVFARWGRPIAPVVFGVQDESLALIKGGIETAVAIAGHELAETDPELGSNLMVFFLSEWDELLTVPKLGELIPELEEKVTQLKERNAHQYRAFRFDEENAIKACFSFVRMSEAMAGVPADVISLAQGVQAMLLWSDRSFTQESPLGKTEQGAVIRADVANVLRAAYNPLLPSASRETSHALRVYARAVSN